MKQRRAWGERQTSETQICLELNLDGRGTAEIGTPIGFLNHMLELLSYHAGFDLKIQGEGDIETDYHHLVEDLGLVLGDTLYRALGNKAGINRFGNIYLPMDEALVLIVVDISGRSYLSYELDFQTEKIGQFDTQLLREFFKSLTNESKITLHIRQITGFDSHHIAEAAFKGLGRCLKQAVQPSGNNTIPSTKGTL